MCVPVWLTTTTRTSEIINNSLGNQFCFSRVTVFTEKTLSFSNSNEDLVEY